MALVFKKVEEVQFDDIKEAPVLTQERRLRIGSLKMVEENREKICETLASCFENNTEQIKSFMLKTMSITHLSKLQAYLLEGNDGVAALDERIQIATKEAIKRSLDKYEATKE